jgi:malonyl-CoA/methylmalonyl-CoA synthetase
MRIAKFKQPKAVILADALPRNTMGKVQKAELRKTHANLFA